MINKSTPIAASTIPTSVKTWALRLITAFTILVAVVAIASLARKKHDEQPTPSAMTRQADIIPLTSQPVAERPKLVIPPRGRARSFPLPPKMKLVVDGDGFLVHSVYADGHECSWSPNTPCPEGASSAYVTNETDREIIVAYAYQGT